MSKISFLISLLGVINTDKIAEKPHQASVVKCQAKRKTRLVNQSLPNNLGKSFRLNKRINKYFSPKYE